MKILFVADVPLDRPASGSEQVLHHQAAGCANAGMEVYAITRCTGPSRRLVRQVAGVKEGTYSASSRDVIRSLLSLAIHPSGLYRDFRAGGRFDAVIVHQPFNGVSLKVTGRLRNQPLLYVFHSPSHEEYGLADEGNAGLKAAINSLARRCLERYGLSGAKKIIVLSEFMARKVQQIHRVPEAGIEVNPGGVDLEAFVPPRDRLGLKRELCLPGKKMHLLAVRNLEPRMGLDNLVTGINLLKERQVAIHLTIVGDGPERGNLERLIRGLRLSGHVTMGGFIPSGRLPEYYGAADFFVLPTRELEGFGLVTPESLACGTPVLGTPVGGTKEILSRFDPDFLFNDPSPEAMADGIERILKEYPVKSEKYEYLRNRCRKYAETNYSWKRHVDQLMATLKDMVQEARAPQR
jgi:glycosyltransferase involved in cell wall biosynthesis